MKFKNVEKHFRSHRNRVNSHGFPWKCWSWILEVCWPAPTTVLSTCLYLWFQLLIFQNYLPGEFPAQKTVQIELVKKPSKRESYIFGVLGQSLPLFSKNFSVAALLYLIPIFSSILGQDTNFLPQSTELWNSLPIPGILWYTFNLVFHGSAIKSRGCALSAWCFCSVPPGCQEECVSFCSNKPLGAAGRCMTVVRYGCGFIYWIDFNCCCYN